MNETAAHAYLRELVQGKSFAFADWPNGNVPRVAPGVYTVWNRSGDYLYAGMAGRSLTAEAIIERRVNPSARTGLWGRLNAHASGKRSGNQFCIYVADRLVLPTLAPDTIAAIAQGAQSFDRLVREFIWHNLAYRFVETRDNLEAFEVERQAQRGLGTIGKPFLNALM